MMTIRRIGFLAALAVTVFSVALVVHPTVHQVLVAVALCSLPGAVVTITYLYPFTVAPTQQQMGPPQAASFNLVVATVIAAAAADTSAVITHNFQLTAAEITQGFPRLTFVPQVDDTTSPWFEASENPNYTVLQKNTLGTGPLTKVFVDRVHKIIR